MFSDAIMIRGPWSIDNGLFSSVYAYTTRLVGGPWLTPDEIVVDERGHGECGATHGEGWGYGFGWHDGDGFNLGENSDNICTVYLGVGVYYVF